VSWFSKKKEEEKPLQGWELEEIGETAYHTMIEVEGKAHAQGMKPLKGVCSSCDQECPPYLTTCKFCHNAIVSFHMREQERENVHDPEQPQACYPENEPPQEKKHHSWW